MRPAAALAVVSCLLLSGCGGSSDRPAGSAAGGGDGRTIEQLWAAAGEDVGITAGTQNHEPGRIRVSFLVIDTHGRPVERPTARVWVATARDAQPFLETTATLERVGVPGGAQADAGFFYVARFRLPRAGTYWMLAEPEGGKREVHALGNVVVQEHDPPPDVGDRAIPSETPTIASVRGDVARLTTRVPPDLPLLRFSVAGSLRKHVPFVVTFATPKFCESRTCGPTVDVVLAVAKRFRADGVRFIHVEVYADNDPAKSYNRWMKEWHLTTEPWTFLVNHEGRIVERFEGVVSFSELARAVRSRLLSR